MYATWASPGFEGELMPQPFSMDLRERVVAAAAHQTQAAVAGHATLRGE